MRAPSYRVAAAAAFLLIVPPAAARAQEATPAIAPADLRLLRLESTPAGALPRMALPMPAHRDHHYWGFRLQTAYRGGRGGGGDLPTVAGGVDLQWRGGSILGVTAGYQGRDCELLGPDCGGHALLEARGRFNIIAGGSRIGSAFGDNSATTTVGAELGFGYAPDVVPGSPACTFDLGVPLSLAMLQTIRLVAFATPGIMWEVDCGGEPVTGQASYMSAFGIGAQQLGHPSLDVYLGVQKIFRSRSGYQIGLSVTYPRLP
jgi:hypothetical protein